MNDNKLWDYVIHSGNTATMFKYGGDIPVFNCVHVNGSWYNEFKNIWTQIYTQFL